MIELYHFILYYIYYLFNLKFDFYFLYNIYCKKSHVIKYRLWRSYNNTNKYNLDKMTDKFSYFKEMVQNKINDEDYIITENNYPYNISDDILHYIIWCNKNPYEIKKILDKKYKSYVFFRNIYKHKSIKNIEHYHIFIKKLKY
jgi:hypothetical protein